MAQADLLAQKIAGTNPEVGFGEGVVLPYRQHSLDTRGFEALERANVRRAAEEAARKKNNEDYYNTTIKNLPEYQREFDQGLSGWRDSIINKSSQMVKNGVRPSQSPEFTKEVLQFSQAANATKQLNADLEKLNTMPVGTYINRESLKGAALKKYTELKDRVNQGDRSAFSESIIPDANDPEHFLFDKFLDDKYGKREDVVTSVDHVLKNDRGERVIGKKVTAKFVTNKDGKIVPGIGQEVIDNDLYSETTDPNTIQFRNALFSLADKQIMNKALELKSSGDPKYSDMGTTQIMQSISANPSDPHYKEFNRRKIAEDIHRSKLEPFQRVSTDNSVGALNEYNKGDGDGSDPKDLRIQPTVITQNTANNVPITAAGVVLMKNNKPIELRVAPKMIYDLGAGKRFKNNDRVNIKTTGLGYVLKRINNDGPPVSFKSIDETVNFINTATDKELQKYALGQVIFGNIEEKKSIQGDTGQDVILDEAGNVNKAEQNVNRTVAIDYEPDGETGAMLDALSNGAFSTRTLSQDEQRVKDAWENRFKAKNTIDPKKKTIEGF